MLDEPRPGSTLASACASATSSPASRATRSSFSPPIVSDVEHIADEILVMRAGSVVLSGRPEELVLLAEGRVWEAVVLAARGRRRSRASRWRMSAMPRWGGRSCYVADKPAGAGLPSPASPDARDLYLYVFRDTAGADSPHAARGTHFKEGRHA